MEREVTFTIKPPVPCTEDQLLEWLRYNLHEIAQMSGTNPLVDYDIEAEFMSVTVR